jgi:hypothetical protein
VALSCANAVPSSSVLYRGVPRRCYARAGGDHSACHPFLSDQCSTPPPRIAVLHPRIRGERSLAHTRLPACPPLVFAEEHPQGGVRADLQVPERSPRAFPPQDWNGCHDLRDVVSRVAAPRVAAVESDLVPPRRHLGVSIEQLGIVRRLHAFEISRRNAAR